MKVTKTMRGSDGGMRSNAATATAEEISTAGRFAVHFLRMAVGLWAEDFPDASIQGIRKADALKLTTKITGKTYGENDFAEAFADLDACRNRLRAARLRIRG